jgi:hypothetical protein
LKINGILFTFQVLTLTRAFVQEDNYTVWASISSILGKLNLLTAYTEYHHSFKAFGRTIFSEIEKQVGWEPQPNEGINTIHF